MAAASNWLEENILNYFFRNQSVAQPTRLYLALYINDPTDSDTGTEINGAGYQRQEISFGPPSQSGGKGTITNDSTIEFPIAGDNWGDVSHWGIKDSSTGGSLVCKGSFNRLETVSVGNRFTIESGNLEVSMD